MPWEWKQEAQKVPARLFVGRRAYPWVRNMMAMTWWAIFFCLIAAIGFGLLVGYGSTGIYQDGEYTLAYYSATTYKAGFTAGIVLMVSAVVASFIIGIMMLIRSHLFLAVSEHGLILAMAVVTLLSIFFASFILGVILLFSLVGYKDLPLKKHALLEKPASPPVAPKV